MKSGLSTLEMECAEQGLDWEDVLEQRALEVARCAELGLPNPYAGPPPAAPAEGYPSDELRTPEGDGGGSNEGAAQPDKEQA
jgi:capsid protein